MFSDGDDYIPLNDVITFDIDDLQQSVSIFILDNLIAEDVEFFSVSISPIPGLFPVAVKNNTATISIKDNDCKYVCKYYGVIKYVQIVD